MNSNPWLVDSVNSFLFFNCPECRYHTNYENQEEFQCHAVENHPWSDVLFNDNLKVDPIDVENRILNSIKKETDFGEHDGENLPKEKSQNSSNKIYLTKHFQCLNCPESFVSKYDLNNHNKSAHDSEKFHKCSECNFSTNGKSNLKRHLQSKHGGKTDTRFFITISLLFAFFSSGSNDKGWKLCLI